MEKDIELDSVNDTNHNYNEKSKSGVLQRRDSWSNNLDFVISCIGFAVGLGNIWRFPYLCYKNGGGAFFIPYLLCLFTCGVPIFMLELAVGQYMGIGSVEAWARFMPPFKGIGIASFVATFQMNIYYIMVLAWALNYLRHSFSTVLPWSHCGNSWNTNRRKLLHRSSGIDEPGSVVWELSLCLLAAWILIYFCVWRGIKWSGKVAYFTALFPYVILTILLVRGATLDGAIDGIYYYLKPDFIRLKDPQVWIDAGTQIFFSYAIALGALVTLASYNKFNHNFFRDCLIISSVNSGTSVYGGFAVFSILGFMAKEQNVTVAEVAASGPGLVFIAYPKAITQLPIPQLWAILFFLMIILIGIDSQFVAVEGFIAPIMDALPRSLYSTRNRMLLTAIYCILSFLIGLTMVTEGGMYVFQLFDYYSASGFVLLWICFFEAVTVGWMFGIERFQAAVELMIGRRVPCWFALCWKYISPLITTAIFMFMLVSFTPLTYGSYIYPRWAQAIGLCMALVSMSCIPVVFIYQLCTTKGETLRKKWQTICEPLLQPHQIPGGCLTMKTQNTETPA